MILLKSSIPVWRNIPFFKGCPPLLRLVIMIRYFSLYTLISQSWSHLAGMNYTWVPYTVVRTYWLVLHELFYKAEIKTSFQEWISWNRIILFWQWRYQSRKILIWAYVFAWKYVPDEALIFLRDRYLHSTQALFYCCLPAIAGFLQKQTLSSMYSNFTWTGHILVKFLKIIVDNNESKMPHSVDIHLE